MMVAFCILEVTILHQFGIQATVGSIADVLEEHSHQLVADSFLLVGPDSQRGIYRLQACEAAGIVFHRLSIQLSIGGLLLVEVQQGIQLCRFQQENLTTVATTVDFHRIVQQCVLGHHICHMVTSLLVGGKVSEIVGSQG